LQTDNLFDLRLVQRQEHDGLVNTVQELRTDGLLQHVHHLVLRFFHQQFVVIVRQLFKLALDVRTTQVGSHDDDGVLEVHRTSLVVGQASVVQHLKQDIEHIRMRLLDFVEQYHRVRLASHGFGQLSTFIVTHVSRRRTDESAHRMLFLILAHVDTGHQRFIVEQVFRQCLGEFRLTHTRCTEEDERANRTFRVLQSGTATTHGIGYRLDGFVLTDDTLVQFVFQEEQLFPFALHHLAHRDACPAGYHVGNVFGGHLFLDHGTVTLLMLQVLLDVVDFIFQGFQLAITDFGHLAIIAFTFRLVGFKLQLLDFLLVLLNLVHQFLFALPLRLVRLFLFAELFDFLVQDSQLGLVLFPLDGFTFDFELLQSAFDFVQFFRQRVSLHTELGCCFVHQVDGLVRKETLGNVAVAQLHSCDDGFVLDTYLMVVFVTFLQPAEDRDGAGGIRFIHHHGLETAFQCLVLFEILLVFVQGSGTDAAEFTTGQGRLQDIGGIHRTFALAGTNEGMDFVDEENDVAFRLGHFVDDRFQSFLEFPLVLRACYQCTHVEREELLVLQIFRHITTEDSLGKTFYDSRLTRTRFTYQDRVVLGASAQDLEYPTDFLVTTDDRVKFARTGCFYQVDGVFAQRLVGVLARLRSHVLPLTKLVDGCTEVLFVHARILQDGSGCTLDVQDGQEHGFQGNILVAQSFAIFYGLLKHLVGTTAQIRFSARYLREGGYLSVEYHGHLLTVHS